MGLQAQGGSASLTWQPGEGGRRGAPPDAGFQAHCMGMSARSLLLVTVVPAEMR